ncbi:MAG: hypothetical protein IPL75_12960 [Acidobacteria bacterium]|nr:hypothetical protein [Acidobacteriota bacterium]
MRLPRTRWRCRTNTSPWPGPIWKRGSSAVPALRNWRSTIPLVKCTCHVSRCLNIEAASATGSKKFDRPANAATPSSLSRPRRVALNAPSSCWPTTKCVAASSATTKIWPGRQCWSPPATCRAASTSPPATCCCSQRPTCSTRNAAAAASAESRLCARLSRTSATSKWTTWSCIDNGIGRFVGLKKMAIGPGGEAQEFMELRYAGEDKLFVPLDRLDLVQKYPAAPHPPRQAGWRDLGKSQDARQEGDARHGRGAAQALRRAQGRGRPRIHTRLTLAARVRRCV